MQYANEKTTTAILEGSMNINTWLLLFSSVLVLLGIASKASAAESSNAFTRTDKQRPEEVMTEAKLRTAAEEGGRIDRDAYGRVVHIFGDSIARGWGLGQFEHPSPLNRIQDIANMLLADNGIDKDDLYIRYAWSQDIGRMADELATGMIRDGDVMLFEDAGPHEDDVDLRRNRFLEMVKLVEGSGNEVQLVLTTMFDYWPTPPYYNSEYDAYIGDSETTMNGVVLDVVQSSAASLLDWNALMDRAVADVRRFGISPMHRDAVHPNIFGNFLLGASLLHHLDVPVKGYASVEQEFLALPEDCYTERLTFARPLGAQQVDAVLGALCDIAAAFARPQSGSGPSRISAEPHQKGPAPAGLPPGNTNLP